MGRELEAITEDGAIPPIFLLHQIVAEKTAYLQTPFFLFDLDSVESKIREVQQHLKPDRLFYAVKCCDLDSILATMRANGVGFEVNNSFELAKVLSTGVEPDNVINSSSISDSQEVAALYAQGVRRFSIDSVNQINNLQINAPGAQVNVRISTSNKGSLFNLNRLGVDTETAVMLLRYAKKSGLVPYGVFFHPGSQSTDLDNWRDGVTKAAHLFRRFPSLQMLNIGGGFPIRYTAEVPTIEDISRVIHETIAERFERKPLLYTEPGRFLVGESGIAVTSVTQIGQRGDKNIAVVDLSVFTGLIEIIENGYDFQYPLVSTSSEAERMYTIIGASCAGTDVIARDVVLPELRVDYHTFSNNDRIIIGNTGAYTLGYIAQKEPSGFNGCRIPRVYYMRGGEVLDA